MTLFIGKCTAQELCAQLDNHISRIDAALANMRTEREDQNLSRSIRQTQESAYQISLKQDKAKKLKQKHAEEKKSNEALEIKSFKQIKMARIEVLKKNLGKKRLGGTLQN